MFLFDSFSFLHMLYHLKYNAGFVLQSTRVNIKQALKQMSNVNTLLSLTDSWSHLNASVLTVTHDDTFGTIVCSSLINCQGVELVSRHRQV